MYQQQNRYNKAVNKFNDHEWHGVVIKAEKD